MRSPDLDSSEPDRGFLSSMALNPYKVQMETDLKDSITHVSYSVYGDEYQFADWALPFMSELRTELAEEGIDLSTTVTPKNYQGVPNSNPIIAIDLEHNIYFQVIFHVVQEFINWRLNKVFDEIANKIERVSKKKLSDEKYPEILRVSISYSDGFSVTIDGLAQSEQDIILLRTSLPEAQKRAYNWYQSHNTTDKNFVYKIREGSLSENPNL